MSAATAQLRVSFKNHRDMGARFGNDILIDLAADGVPVPDRAQQGKELVFSFPSAAKRLRLAVRVDASDGAGGAPVAGAVFRLEQELAVELQEKRPRATPAGPAPFTAQLDPRLELRVVQQGGAVIKATVDLLCVDVTTHLRLRSSVGMLLYDHSPGLHVGGLGPHYGVELRVVEMATASHTWCVLVPPAARKVAAPGVLVFYRPRGNAYADSDVALGKDQHGGFTRYVLDPPQAAPWHLGWLERVNEFPPCGFERQVGEANRPAIFVYPLPDASGFTNSVGPNLLSHLDALLATLQTTPSQSGSGTVLGVGQSAPLRRGRLGLAGFSFGGAACLSSFGAISQHVDELYLLDPANLKGSEGISTWWRKPGRRLGLIGGFFFLGTFRGMARQLTAAKAKDGLDSEVHLFPRDGGDRFHHDVDGFSGSMTYPFALTAPGHVPLAMSDQFELDPDGQPQRDEKRQPILTGPPPAGSLSALSGIFFVRHELPDGFTQVVVGGRTPTGQPFEVRAPRTALPELVARAQIDWAADPANAPPPLTSRAALARWVARGLLEPPGLEAGDIGTIRHQWPAVGGEGDVHRGPGFKGYLQLCLERSGF
ncbi:MAG: hypothetical protein AB7N76_19605 [Planctomycetota bacterium]